jgi:16S rRNA (cytosine967-C5)-methyltransferase
VTTAREVALRALLRVHEGAYANLVLPPLLATSGLDERDRGFATELVYGATRMRRACDFLVDRFVLREPDATVRAALRLGAYQLAYLRTPAHAAVSETVAVVPRRARGMVNAVLRRVAADLGDAGSAGVVWPDEATRLSYPDWIVNRLVAEHGRVDATAALEAMNQAAVVTERPDGYVQDLASQWVTAHVGARPDELVADLCAGPGGKATGMAEAGAHVIASDVARPRADLVAANACRLGLASVATLVADGRRPPLRPGSLDRVLVDAPCSGLGVLRRRPDARWRIREDDVDRLVALQVELLGAARALLRPDGSLVYSVCTLTSAETTAVADAIGAAHPDLQPLERPGPPWRPWGSGAILLPQDVGTDGMVVFSWTRRSRTM